MTISRPADTCSARPAPDRSHRDPAIDLVRAALIPAVVVIHALMVGIGRGPDGVILGNATEGQDWFTPVSWLAQIMPLFFIVGGYAAAAHWRRMRGRGEAPADYVATRLRRLLPPALVLAVVVGGGLALLRALGVDPAVLDIAGFRIGQPLWFLGVYILCSALVPLTLRCHEARPATSLAVLAGAALSVDLLRGATGVEGIGYANLLFVWLTVQQLGYWLADGRLDGLSRQALRRGAALGVLATLGLAAAGPSTLDLFDNLNPPTSCLIAYGVAQLCLFALARPWLSRLAAGKRVARVAGALGARAMTIYLWHMPAIIVLAGLLLLSGVALPAPLSPEWWASRPLWLLAVAAAVLPAVRVFGGAEASAAARRHPGSLAGVAFAVLAGACGVLLLLSSGFSGWLGGAALLVLALHQTGYSASVSSTKPSVRFTST